MTVIEHWTDRRCPECGRVRPGVTCHGTAREPHRNRMTEQIEVVPAEQLVRAVTAERNDIVDDLRYGNRGMDDIVGPSIRNALADIIEAREQS